MNKILQNILFGVFIISLMSLIFLSFGKKRDDIKSNVNNSKFSTISPIGKSEANVWSTLHQWKDYDQNSYSDYFKVRLDDFYGVESYKKSLDTWGEELYRMLYNYDRPNLDLIYVTLSNIQYNNKLDRLDFAKVLVSFVQSIPYAYVLENSCDEEYNLDPEVKEAMDNGTQCDGFNTWGLNSPVEFMKNSLGDCDTRTLFLYTIMRKFRYDVVILNSDTHSILGVKLPSSGNYLSYLGERYYMWETTAKNWEIGDVSPSDQNDSWEIIP